MPGAARRKPVLVLLLALAVAGIAYAGSYRSIVGALNAACSSGESVSPRSSRTCSSTDAACSPPITLMRAFGHIQSWRGL